MSRGIIETVGGGAAIAFGALVPGALPAAVIAAHAGFFLHAAAIAPFLIQAGAGLVINGIGTMLAKGKDIKGFATTERNPIAPWEIVLGETRVGGSITFLDDPAPSRAE